MINDFKYIENFIGKDLSSYLSSWSLNTPDYIGDQQVPMSHFSHSKDAPIYHHLLWHLLPRMNQETGLDLKPIFCYNRIYLPGAVLNKHKDRTVCEISASIPLDYYYIDDTYKWPLCMGDKPFVIKKGDGIIYKGANINHWRPVFIQELPSWHHQVFVFYVDKNGPFKDLKEEINDDAVDLNKEFQDKYINYN